MVGWRREILCGEIGVEYWWSCHHRDGRGISVLEILQYKERYCVQAEGIEGSEREEGERSEEEGVGRRRGTEI